MARLFVKAAGSKESLELKSGLNRLGRSPSNDFPLDHGTVSSNHCEIVVAADGVTVRDLGSTNGTFLNGRQIREAVLLPGQTLRLGDMEMVFEVQGTSLAAPTVSVPSLGPVAIPAVGTATPAAPVAEVSIPKLSRTPVFTALPEGAIACANHPEFPATDQCQQCHAHFCGTCVHVIRRVGGAAHRLCPTCGGACVVLADAGKKPKRSLMGYLRKTLKIFNRSHS